MSFSLTGAETWAVAAVPNPTKPWLDRYRELQRGGIVVTRTWFDKLIVDREYQFVFVFPPVLVKGATGWNGCPIAVTRKTRTTEWAL
jgi:hypothetical protein